MSLDEKITDLHESVGQLTVGVGDLTHEVVGKMGVIDQRMLAKEQDVDQAIADLTVLGDGGVGSTVVNAANFLTLEPGSDYLHFKLPIKSNEDDCMIHLHVRGYAYAEAKIVDATMVGYCFTAYDNLTNVDTQGSHEPSLYKGSDNTIYARLSFTNCYYLTVTVDTTRVGAGKIFRRGDIEIIKSPNLTL